MNNSGPLHASMGSVQPIQMVFTRDCGDLSVRPGSRIDDPCVPASGE